MRSSRARAMMFFLPLEAVDDLDPAEDDSPGPASASTSTPAPAETTGAAVPDGASAAALALSATPACSDVTKANAERRRRKLRRLERRTVSLAQQVSRVHSASGAITRRFEDIGVSPTRAAADPDGELTCEKTTDMFLVGVLTFAFLGLLMLLATDARDFFSDSVRSPSLRDAHLSSRGGLDFLDPEAVSPRIGIEEVGMFGKYSTVEHVMDTGDLKEG